MNRQILFLYVVAIISLIIGLFYSISAMFLGGSAQLGGPFLFNAVIAVGAAMPQIKQDNRIMKLEERIAALEQTAIP